MHWFLNFSSHYSLSLQFKNRWGDCFIRASPNIGRSVLSHRNIDDKPMPLNSFVRVLSPSSQRSTRYMNYPFQCSPQQWWVLEATQEAHFASSSTPLRLRCSELGRTFSGWRSFLVPAKPPVSIIPVVRFRKSPSSENVICCYFPVCAWLTCDHDKILLVCFVTYSSLNKNLEKQLFFFPLFLPCRAIPAIICTRRSKKLVCAGHSSSSMSSKNVVNKDNGARPTPKKQWSNKQCLHRPSHLIALFLQPRNHKEPDITNSGYGERNEDSGLAARQYYS